MIRVLSPLSGLPKRIFKWTVLLLASATHLSAQEIAVPLAVPLVVPALTAADKSALDATALQIWEEGSGADDPFVRVRQLPNGGHEVRLAIRNVQWLFGDELMFAARIFSANAEQQSAMRRLAAGELDYQREKLAELMEAEWLGVNGKEIPDLETERVRSTERILHAVFWCNKNAGEDEPEIFDTWRSEVKARREYRNVAYASLVVNMLDRRLVLNSEQLESLLKALAHDWQPEWSCDLHMIEEDQLPPIPEETVREHLTNHQYAAMKQMARPPTTARSWHEGGRRLRGTHPWFANDTGDEQKRSSRQIDNGEPFKIGETVELNVLGILAL